MVNLIMAMIVPKRSKPFIIFEIANNHFGSVEHGKLIIKEFAKFITEYDFDFGVKFQYRNLDSFIHEFYKSNSDFQYIKRFTETKLSYEDLLELKNSAESLGFKTICTPFDETSVRKIVEHGFDYLKIASASFTDWPLIEDISKNNLPVIASTAGATTRDLRKVISFLTKRISDLTIMHCVAKYPTEDHDLALDRIDFLKNNYKNIDIGYSAHEIPTNTTAVSIAYAKGARVFEKHIGLETIEYANNKYSCTSDQIRYWLDSLSNTIDVCRFDSKNVDVLEINVLNNLRRGVYAKNDIGSGSTLKFDDVFFAIPSHEGQLLANDWSKFMSWTSLNSIKKNDPIYKSNLDESSNEHRIESIASVAKVMCDNAGVILPNIINFEISHHYGLDRFDEFGLILITLVNRDYCKKVLILFPGQSNPEHHHKIKEESFYCVSGDVKLVIEGEILELKAGDLALIPTGKRHSFSSLNGAVIEEISSTSIPFDSYYSDPKIEINSNRKSRITLWN
jgi:sialic acid synthase SpsE/mannose-6-phosphate isomerase-like protein (cupin superfamily)